MPTLKAASTLQDHCLPQTTVTEPNFIQGIFSTLSNLKISLSFHFEFERVVRDILPISIGPNLILLYVQAKSPICTKSLLV